MAAAEPMSPSPTIHPVSFPNGSEQLVGSLHLGAASPRAALLLPGWGGTRYGPQRILVDAAQALAEAGWTSLRFDFRGRGDSQGDPAGANLDGMISDTLAAAQWLRAEHGARAFTFVGLCAGANVALGAASLLLRETEALVAWSLLPLMEHKAEAHGRKQQARRALLGHYLRKALDLESWKKLLRGEANLRGAVQTLKQDKEGDEEEKQRKTSARDILKDLAKWRGSCLMVFGTKDPESADSCRFFEQWMKKQRIPSETHWIEGAPHNFYTARWTREVIQLSVDWLRRTLPAAPRV